MKIFFGRVDSCEERGIRSISNCLYFDHSTTTANLPPPKVKTAWLLCMRWRATLWLGVQQLFANVSFSSQAYKFWRFRQRLTNHLLLAEKAQRQSFTTPIFTTQFQLLSAFKAKREQETSCLKV